MADINQIVSVTITAQANAPARESFGIPAIYVYHEHNSDLIRTYTDLSGLTADGFDSSEPAYLMAQAIVSQTPRPPVFKVIRGTTKVAQTFTFQVTDTTVGDIIGLSLLGPDGVLTDLKVTGTGTPATDAASLAGLTMPSGLTAGAVSDTVTFTASDEGAMWYTSLVPADSSSFLGGIRGGVFKDTTPDVSTGTGTGNSIADDLDATILIDKDFYGIATQYMDATNISNVSDWAESNKRILAYVTADSENITGTSAGIMHTLKGASHKYSFGVYTQHEYGFAALGLMANRFTADPGTDTWDAKNVAGAQPDDYLTPTQQQNIQTNNGNFYSTTAGLEIMTDGRSAQGQYMDLTRGIDALANDMQIAVFGLIASSPKVPYTQKGISAVAAEVAASLARFTATDADPNQLLSNDSGFQPKVLAPDIKTISSADKKNRVLRKMNWTATAAGAIQTVQIQGFISF